MGTGVLNQIHGKSCLTHRGAARHNHQIRGLKARGFLIQINKAGSETGDVTAGVIELFDSLQRTGKQRRHALGATQLRAALRNRHDESLCLIHQLLSAATLRVKACGRNILCRANQLSQ